jgi:hypothetical protein
MAIGLHAQFTIYHDQLQTGFNETLIQETDAFNAASQGAIVMRQNLHEGYYAQEAFFKAVTGLVTRRDLTADPATPITDLALTQGEIARVKLFRKIGPIANTRGSFRTILRDPGEFSVLIGQQAAKATVIEQLNASLRAAVAALAGQTAVVHNVTAASPTDTISTDNLIQTLGKAGDSSNDIVLWVMHSTAYYKLVQTQVASHSFDSVAGVNIATGTPVTLGRPVLVTDSPQLHGATSPTDPVRVLGLRRGAIDCAESELEDFVVADVTGGAQLAIRAQGEFAFSLGVMGFTYDIANGGANPLDAALGTTSNWDKVVTSNKSLAGVMMIADPA